MVPASSIGVSPVVNPFAPNMLPDQLTRFGLTSDNSDKKNTRICNCKRSNCLKLYCECFASGAYCQPGTCNCNNCLNNVKNNDSRREAVDATLERNPNAFRSKIFITETDGGDTSTKHHKGCHCKKSYCLKKYCECYQGGVVCSEKCRCHDCRNYTGSTYLLEAVQKTQQKDPVEGETTNDSNNEEGNRGSSYIKTNSHLSRSVENSSGGEFLSDTTLQMICKSVQEEYNKGAKSAKKRPFSDTEENATATRSDINSSSASDDIRPSQSLKTIAVDSFSESLRGLLVSSLASTLSPDMVSGIVSLSLISPMKSQSLQSGGDIGTTLSLNNQAPQVHRPTSPSHQSHGDSLTQSQNENSDASSQCHTQVGEGQRTEGTQNSGNDASCSQNCGPSIAPLLSNSSGPSARSAIPESSIENMPSLLGKSSLTLEPTVSMQQMEAQATHWMKQQCKYSDLK